MSSDNLQMHPINNTAAATAAAADTSSGLVNSQNSNSSSSMALKAAANIQFVSDTPITDPGPHGTGKVSES